MTSKKKKNAKPSRHHYVWRKYLEAWMTNGQVWCMFNEPRKCMPIGTTGIAVEKDFYKLPNLLPDDYKFIYELEIKSAKGIIRDAIQDWVKFFKLHQQMMTFVERQQKIPKDMLKDAKDELSVAEERFHSKIEGDAQRYLSSLIAGNTAFLSDDTDSAAFYFFLAVQYFRTRNIQENIRATFESTPLTGHFNRCWPILRHIYATKVGAHMFLKRKTMRVQLLEAPDEFDFITGDQPIINTYAAYIPKDIPVEECEFFYPVSPRRAVFISEKDLNLDVAKLSQMRAAMFNEQIARLAREQLYAKQESDFKNIYEPFGKR